MRSEAPNPAIINTDTTLSAFAEMPLRLTIVERNSVKNVKLRIKPMTTPRGRAFPEFSPLIVEDRMIGKMGRIHGERIVTIPASNANAVSIIIDLNKYITSDTRFWEVSQKREPQITVYFQEIR